MKDSSGGAIRSRAETDTRTGVRAGLTLRQIEVIRAVMIAGTIAGAARLMNVAQPGVSRTMKHIEGSLGIKLFVKKAGRHVPTDEARDIFAQLQEVHRKVDDLQYSIGRLERGLGVELAIGSVPSIATVMAPEAVAKLMRFCPDIKVNFDILKIEEAIDYLLLGKGEVVAMSYKLSHPSITFEPLSKGHLVCITAKEHPLASRSMVSAREIAEYPLIGIDPRDPYGAIMAGIFEREGLRYDIPIRARFGTTVCALVKRNLGVAVIDAFTVGDMENQGIAIIPISEDTVFQTYVAYRADADLSSYAERFVAILRREMDELIHRAQMSRKSITKWY
ncbi:DNA-binding transcriptional LysR family regulator [Ciceribacter lividus]|uniref:DNA-binding transcriptional LysR family regulator n=1 Tax=Ciceribacter lividus TaxID=1197950 RepID=A0A6I7HGJ4_9HYPH|nr:LysR family transcriptional regulator [Ciceribacter lividus]RCW19935.1 DNA-binding transcriptional LysR family regulator [Ciceribacter lividus]